MVSNISQEVGKKIRAFRMNKNYTLEDLSKVIYKSKSTISKYESGDIKIDIDTLYDISTALDVDIEQLLWKERKNIPDNTSSTSPAFFNGSSQFYSYFFDGRSGKVVPCVFNILSKVGNNKYKIVMYMNYENFEYYQNCENTYWGHIEHYDALTCITLINSDTYMEKPHIQILASYLDSDTKWGIFTGLSSRPMMPIALKMLFSKSLLPINEDLENILKISKQDIKNLRWYNMLPVT